MSKFGLSLAFAGFVFAIAGFIVWELDSKVAGSFQAANTANIALYVGTLGLVVGIVGVFTASRGP